MKEKLIKRGPQLAFSLLILFFLVGTTLVALNLQGGIIPDEWAHTILIEGYEKQIGVPPENEVTIKRGVFFEGNPFLYYWLAARLRNLTRLIIPRASVHLVNLVARLFSVVCSTATLVFTWLTSKELIKDKWLQLLPPFFLANLLMFFFLSAGISYDNLLNLLFAIAIFMVMCLTKQKEFWTNSMWLALVLALAGLTKKTALPLILIIFFLWVYLFIRFKPGRIQLNPKRTALLLCALIAIGVNVLMYGRNLILYRKIVPGCYELATSTQCQTSGFVVRKMEYGLEKKMTIAEAVEAGYPNPIEYYFGYWSKIMINRNVGISGHKIYSNPLKTYFPYILVLIAALGTIYLKNLSLSMKALFAIAFGYLLSIFIFNYDMQLLYVFEGFAIQGRYIYPVITAFLTIIAAIIESIKPKLLKGIVLSITLILSLISGPLHFLVFYQSFFHEWF